MSDRVCFTCQLPRPEKNFGRSNSMDCCFCFAENKKRCTKCELVKTIDDFKPGNSVCNQCHSNKSNDRYHDKMKCDHFKEAERHRRMEKFHRRRKEHFLKLYKESIRTVEGSPPD